MTKDTLSTLISEREFARRRGVHVRSLQRERAARKGPPYITLGRSVYYRPEAIEEWLLAQEVTPVRSELRDRA